MEGGYLYFTKFKYNQKVHLIDLGCLECRIIQIMIEDTTRYRIAYFAEKNCIELTVNETELKEI